MEFEKLKKQELSDPMELRQVDAVDHEGAYFLSVKLSACGIETERVGPPGSRGVRLRPNLRVEFLGPNPPEAYPVLADRRDGLEAALAEGVDAMELLGRLVEAIDPGRQTTGPCYAAALALWQSAALELVAGAPNRVERKSRSI